MLPDMTATTPTDLTEDEIRRERLVHIDQMLADHDRKRQEIKYALWQIVLATITATSAVFIAGAAVGALLVNLGRSIGHQ
jgi:hypothetical protein